MKGKKNWKVIVLMTAVVLSLTSAQVFATVAPSVSQKAAPEVVGAATFTDADGNAITINAGDIKITSDGAEATLSPEEKVIYDKAKAEFTNPDSQYTKDLGDFMTKNFPGIDSDKVVVREIFDINVGQELSFDKGQKLELTLGGNYKPGDTVIVTVYNKDTGKWDFIESNDVKVNADGTITVKFPHLCPIAILVADMTATTATTTVENTKKNAAPPAVTGEAGGSGSNTSMLIPALGLGAVILAVVFVALKKKKSV
ncbi:hypothetical protein GH811_03515 [Acetobacterium malicum]|uniref:Gram-positive cocci surface proteins LPxTG domain-containing protein n=1 Tax=Acetobacterium malicum TaxID=52692 RepID=A0ABR6YU42_9FIRM|nr:hypothetical protein [Acetobacterium malicum]MBC3898680.1 hypothetical protein [Acetobacterium malicum]